MDGYERDSDMLRFLSERIKPRYFEMLDDSKNELAKLIRELGDKYE